VAISSVPDGMAAAVLTGVNPVHGLYACFAGPIAGGLTTSTRLMVVTTTSAAALAAGSALQGVPAGQRSDALLLLTLLAGAVMVAAAVLRLGRYIRFVSHSVMLGFLTGVAVNIILGQLPNMLGIAAVGDFPAAKALDALEHLDQIQWASLATGALALAILVVLTPTRIGLFSAIVALAVPTVLVIAGGLDEVARVSDVGDVPAGVPLPGIPDLGAFDLGVLTGALAVAAIVIVQGAGVANAAPNPDGSRSLANQDIGGQGAANVASALFGGQPVGGSVGETALNVAAGARSRWAGIYAGFWMLAILVALSWLVGEVAMPTLAAVLVFAGFSALRPHEAMTVLRSGRTAQIAFVTTFIATLFLPIAAAVGIGVALSLLLQLNQESVDLKVVRLIPDGAGRFSEAPAPRRLEDDDVIVLDVYGSLFYAGARTLELRLPEPGDAHRAAVILRLRGRTTLGATFYAVVGDYARKLAQSGGRLYLSGVDDDVADRWERDGLAQRAGSIRLYRATPLVGESTYDAFLGATSRLVQPDVDEPDGSEPDSDGSSPSAS